MRLNPDCIRDILLCVEKTTDAETGFKYSENSTVLSQYSDNEIRYHFRQCNMSGFFSSFEENTTGSIQVIDLAPKGHEFLANIREDTVWNGVKSVASKVGSTSLKCIVQIASNVVSELIKSQFGLSGATTV